MKQLKRSQTDTFDDYNNNNKKFKSLNSSEETIHTKKSLFEDLANETLYEIFDYLDIHHAYEAFFDLNKRFENLFRYFNLPIHVNISTMSKSSFERYHQNIIVPNKQRINYLRLSNPFTVDIVFSPPRMISKFIRLKILVLDNIKATYLDNILNRLNCLSELQSLTINPIDHIENSSLFYRQIFRLPKLKYCQIKFEATIDREPLFFENKPSPIEHLVIKTRFRYQSFINLLLYLPKLRYLSIDGLDGSSYQYVTSSSIILNDFKHVSLKLDLISFDQFEIIVKNSFHFIENLRVTTKYDPAYLDAKRWEQLIVIYIPNLRVFDINHDGLVQNGPLSYHDLINQFNSSFWIERKWFFTHQHDWQARLDSAVFHSTDPYRRKDYTMYWELAGQVCPHLDEHNLNTVQHVRIGGKQVTRNRTNYFPNATELTIKHKFNTPDDSIAITLNRIVPLQQLKKLVIEYCEFTFEQIVHLIRFTPNLHTLKICLLSINKKTMKSFEESEIFRNVSTTNKIKYFKMNDRCTYEQIPMLVHLFPQLEYFQIAMKRKEIRPILRYLLSKNNHHTCHLFFLSISSLPKVCLREVNILIQIEGLLDQFLIKYVNRILYLWW